MARHLVRTSYIDILGGIWWPYGAECSLRKTLSQYDIDNMRDEDGAIRRRIERLSRMHARRSARAGSRAVITITIRTENAAFQDSGDSGAAEVARILRKMAEQLDESAAFRFCRVYDSNGNSVGEVKLTGKDRRL